MPNVVVSNGAEFFEIDANDLDDARTEGFYLPHEQGMAVVTNGVETLEIPREDLTAAEADGFRCLSSQPKPAAPPKPPASSRRKSPLPPPPAVDASALPTDGKTNTAPAVPAALVEIDETPDEETLRREELRQRMEEAEGFERVRLWVQLRLPSRRDRDRFLNTYGLAALLHLIVLIALSFYALSSEEFLDGGAIQAAFSAVDSQLTDASEIPQEVVIEASETESGEANDPAGEIDDAIGEFTAPSDALSATAVGGGLDGLADELGKGLDQATGTGEKASAAFFGSNTVASKFVFVIDNSLSMTKGRFETALNELAKTIVALTPQQSFYIVFYSDTAYPIFHPQKIDQMIPATQRNKQLALQWLGTVPLCLRTDFAEALQISYAMEPDVIFVLGDGAFTDNGSVRKVMNSRPERLKAIRIHALGMEVSQKDAQNFIYLAKETGGSYNDVGVHPAGRVLAQQNPRAKFKNHVGVWGIKLPPK